MKFASISVSGLVYLQIVFLIVALYIKMEEVQQLVHSLLKREHTVDHIQQMLDKVAHLKMIT